MRPLTDKEIAEYFGTFTYIEQSGGAIYIDPMWQHEHIVREKIPVIGTILCHKEVVLDLYRIFTRIALIGSAKYVNIKEFRANIAGCFVPRHKTWDPKRSLSRHSWGIAIDLNIKKNPYGAKPNQHWTIVEAFERSGFYWGGRFSKPDGMHFEPSDKWQQLKQIVSLKRQ